MAHTEPATDLPARAQRYVDGVWHHREELDVRIGAAATGWRVERMPPVDRNILRLGLYELTYTDTPVGVAISEAVELAKTYSTARSGAFVNGVLAQLATA
jgi:N utilization substance protein B